MASFSSETSGPDNLSLFSAVPDGGGQKAKQRRASIQSLTQMEKIRSPADKDALFTSIQETSWTVADHHRLYAIDRLQTRIMEYHNNVHRRGHYNKFQPSGVRPDDVIAFLMTCSASQSDKPFQPIEKGHLAMTTRKVNAHRKAGAGSGVQWVHLMDLSALPIIAEELKLDPLCCEHFSDLRFHSMMLPVLGGCCLSVCYFQLDPFTLSVGMFKMYFYLTDGLIVTFVAELMPELEATGNNTNNERDARTVQALLTQDDVPVAIDAVFNAVVDRWEDISQRAAELGPIFVFYQLASEALVAQDTLLEFLSRTIFHFKKKTSFRLSYRKKLQLVKRMHIVNTAINLVESCTARAANVVEKLAGTVADRNIAHMSSFNNTNANANNTTGAPCLTMDSLIPLSILGVRQLPVLADLQNSYAFAHSCLVNEAKEVRIVSEAIDSISQMRADHTALVLSLIATIFLPATFLTGVFGMNFQEHGGYTIRMVNSKYGPLVFYLLCIVLAITLTTYYVSMGWIEAFGFVRFTLNALCGKKTMMWMLGGDFEEDINDDPEVRTPKLVNVNTIAYTGNNGNGTTAAGSDLSVSEMDDRDLVGRGISLPAKSVASDRSGAQTVRSPFAGAASHSGEGKTQQVHVQHLVPERVAEALEEEVRRQEEAAQRRNLAHLQGLHSSTAVAHPIMRGSLGNRPSLLQRSRLRNSRLSSGASSDYSASISGKPAGAGSVQSGVSSSKI